MESVVLSAAGGLAGVAVAYAGARAMIAMVFPGAHDLPVDAVPVAARARVCDGGVARHRTGRRPRPGAHRLALGSDRRDARRRTRGRRARFPSPADARVAAGRAVARAGDVRGTPRHEPPQPAAPGLRVSHRGPLHGPAEHRRLAPSRSSGSSAIYRRLSERLGRIPGVTNAGLLALRSDGREQLDCAHHGRRPRRRPRSCRRPGIVSAPATSRPSARAWSAGASRTRATRATRLPSPSSVKPSRRGSSGRRIRSASASGSRDRNGGGSRDIEIVGVVGDAKYQEARRPAYATFFLPFLQQPSSLIAAQPRSAIPSNIARSIQLRLDRPVPGLEADVRAALADVDPGFTVVRVRELDGAGDGQLQRPSG